MRGWLQRVEQLEWMEAIKEVLDHSCRIEKRLIVSIVTRGGTLRKKVTELRSAN